MYIPYTTHILTHTHSPTHTYLAYAYSVHIHRAFHSSKSTYTYTYILTHTYTRRMWPSLSVRTHALSVLYVVSVHAFSPSTVLLSPGPKLSSTGSRFSLLESRNSISGLQFGPKLSSTRSRASFPGFQNSITGLRCQSVSTGSPVPVLGAEHTETWNWKGRRVRYARSGPEYQNSGKPAIVLVHGFGSSGDTWRNQFSVLAREGYSVYAIDLLGFGGSDKPVEAPYSIDMWAEQVCMCVCA
jgi:hypothetical protein